MKSVGSTANLVALLANSNKYVIYDEFRFRLPQTQANPATYLVLTATTQDLDAFGIVQAANLTAPTGPTARPGVGSIKVKGRTPGPTPHWFDTMDGSGNIAVHTANTGQNYVAFFSSNQSQLVLNNAGALKSGTGASFKPTNFTITDQDAHAYWDCHVASSANGFAGATMYLVPDGGIDASHGYMSYGVSTDAGGTGANVSVKLVSSVFGGAFGSNTVVLGNQATVFGANASVLKRVDAYRVGMTMTIAFDGVNKGTLVIQPEQAEMGSVGFSMGSGGTANAATLGEVDFTLL